jgi:DNA-binding GntR family transcriptional regulator
MTKHKGINTDPAKSAAGTPDMVDRIIYRNITDAVFEQRMPPGTRLSEARLGALYNVIRTVVRKALIRLASDKLVDMRPHRGAVVSQPTIAEAREVFDARRIIEAALLEYSIPALSAADHQYLYDLGAADLAAHKSHDAQQMVRASGDFHLGLAALSGNAALYRFLEQLIGRTSLIIAMYQSHALPACSHRAHSELIEMIERADVAGAQQAMRQHLTDIENRLDLSGHEADGGLARILGPQHIRA